MAVATTPRWVRARTWDLELPFRAASVRAARHALDAFLARAKIDPVRRADALVVLSELLANSLRHARPAGGGLLRVLWRLTDTEIELAVGDAGSQTEPSPIPVAELAASGRGLAIVETLAKAWGVSGAHTSDQVVWAVLPRGTLADRGR